MKLCTMCESKIGTTFGTIGTRDFCLRCHGRVALLLANATAPFRELLKELEWVDGDDQSLPGCRFCNAIGPDRNPARPRAADPHDADCKLDLAIKNVLGVG